MTHEQEGDALITFVEKVTGNDFSLLLGVSLDVSCYKLTDYVAFNFASGQGYSRTFEDTDGSDLGGFDWDQSQRYAYKFKFGGSFVDLGKSFFDLGIRAGDTVELHHE